MYLTYHGLSCFKFQNKEITLITDPFEEKYGLKLPKFRADFITVSHSHTDHNNIEAVKGPKQEGVKGNKAYTKPFIISGPGEYEIKGVSIIGIPSFHDNKEGRERGVNTIYLITLGNIKICHLGDLGHLLTNKQIETIGQVDVLLVPADNTVTLDVKKVYEVVSQIEPRIVIPMHYKLPGLINKNFDPVNKFLKEIGIKEEKIDKLKIIKKDLPSEGMKVIILEALKC